MSPESTPIATAPTHLALKLTQLMLTLQRLPKNGFNAAAQYAYVQEADVTDTLRTLMAQAHLALLPQVDSVSREGNLTTVWMTFQLVDADSGETHAVRWPGEGADRSDKGLAKAITNATKYFLLKTFMLSAGDDPEQATPADVAPSTPSSSASTTTVTRPELPKEAFAVRIIAGSIEQRKVRNDKPQLFFRGQAVLESTQEHFGVTAWQANAQLLAHAQKQTALVVIQGQWHDRYPEFKVQTAQWPPHSADPGPNITPEPSPTPESTPAPSPSATAPATPPSPASTAAIKKQLWDSAQRHHLDLPQLLQFTAEHLDQPITKLGDLSQAQVQQILTALETDASPKASAS